MKLTNEWCIQEFGKIFKEINKSYNEDEQKKRLQNLNCSIFIEQIIGYEYNISLGNMSFTYIDNVQALKDAYHRQKMTSEVFSVVTMYDIVEKQILENKIQDIEANLSTYHINEATYDVRKVIEYANSKGVNVNLDNIRNELRFFKFAYLVKDNILKIIKFKPSNEGIKKALDEAMGWLYEL